MKRTFIRLSLVAIHPESNTAFIPLGVASIAAYLEQFIKNAGGQQPKLEITILENRGEELTAGWILDRKPDIVGFSLYAWNTKRVFQLAREIRNSESAPILVAGGPDAEYCAALFRDSSMSSEKTAEIPFDAVFLGEAEKSFAHWFLDEFLGGTAALQQSSPKFIPSIPCEPEELVSPWLSGYLVPSADRDVAWEMTRGCPYHCTYCYEGRGSSRVRALPKKRLEAELELFEKRAVPKVFVLDPTFNLNPARALSMIEMLAKKAPSIYWYLEIRAELVTPALAEAFARLPCSLQIGLQSADSAVLKTVGRSIDRKLFAEKIRFLNQSQAVFGLDLMYGLPGDSLESFFESLDFALSLQPNHLDIFPLAVLPGTILYDQRVEFDLEAEPEPPYLLRQHPGFSRYDMEKAGKVAKACEIFYSRGRAVPWFLAVLKPLKLKPSRFFMEGLECLQAQDWKHQSMTHRQIEELQIAALRNIYEKMGKEKLLPAVQDLVRYFGALSRAYAEQERSRITLNYPLADIESGFLMRHIERYCERHQSSPAKIDISPSKKGPNIKIL